VLDADGRRKNGRWKRDSVANQEFLNTDWRNKVTQAGIVLDHAPDLAEQVVNGALALDAAREIAPPAQPHHPYEAGIGVRLGFPPAE